MYTSSTWLLNNTRRTGFAVQVEMLCGDVSVWCEVVYDYLGDLNTVRVVEMGIGTATATGLDLAIGSESDLWDAIDAQGVYDAVRELLEEVA